MNQGPFDTLSRQIEELRALIEDIHQAVAATPRYRGVIEKQTNESRERQ
jgi:hypothetical protein